MIETLLADAELLSATRSLRGHASAHAAEAALAHAVWSVIAEPGDGVAGALVAELGAPEALRVALDGVDSAAGTERARRALDEARRRWMPRAEGRAVREALDGARHVSARLLLPGDEDWPESFADLGVHAPSALWARGDTGLLTADARVAIVGARASTSYGEHVAAELAGDLAAQGTVVVSGGAYGIDGAAHRAALGVGGPTIAFLAGGVDRAYPAGHQQLLGRICAQGLVVAEVPCGSAPTKWRFLSRNRLIAASSRATVVVEAGWRSGSLNTAGHAAALGRPLGAVPGPVTSAASAGCHRLMREYDARCVTSAAEVRELWSGDAAGTSDGAGPGDRAGAPADPDQLRLLDALSTRTWTTSTELARRSGLAPERVRSLLGLLELDGAVSRGDAGWRRVRAGS